MAIFYRVNADLIINMDKITQMYPKDSKNLDDEWVVEFDLNNKCLIPSNDAYEIFHKRTFNNLV